jgi:hypothetical protein
LPSEARARIKINNLLTEAGWRLIDSTSGKANVKLEAGMRMDEMGADFERAPKGVADYILLDENQFPACVLEAKSEDKDPLVGKEQARKYAKTQKARYIVLSNGNLHYFWDTEKGNPTRVSRFPSLETLGVLKAFKPDLGKIPAEKVESDYVVLTKVPNSALPPEDPGAILFLTMHGSKGITKKTVVMPGLENAWMPGNSKDNDLDERRRQFYVALTRATDCVLITYPGRRLLGDPLNLNVPGRGITCSFIKDCGINCNYHT